MKNRKFILGLMVLPLSALYAREIRGIVTDIGSNPIEFANITAFANDSVSAGGITDSEGLFRFETPGKCDSIRVSSFGYESIVISPVSQDVGIIRLKPISTTLQEVVVKAQLITREADRIVLNVAADPLSADKDAGEILKVAPGVWATDDELSIYGNGGTAVYVDDRKINMSGNRLMAYLKSIRGSSVATIEIIPRAGAEYSADSSGGIIKINMRRSRVDGLNGATGFTVTSGEYKLWVNPFINFSMHKGKWTLNLNGNLNGSPFDRYTTTEETSYSSISRELKGISRHNGKTITAYAGAGVFFDPSANDRLGLQIEYNPERSHHSSDSESEMTQTGIMESTTGRYINENSFHSLTAAFNWTHSIDEKGSDLKLISNYNYQLDSSDNDNRMEWSDMPTDSVYKTDNLNRYNIIVTEVSIRKVLDSKWTLNAGGMYTHNDVSNSSSNKYLKGDTWISNNRFDYDHDYKENFLGIYATANGKTGRWKFKAGLRGKYYKTKGTYGIGPRMDIFPSANISFDLSEKGDYNVSTGYYRSIRRPSFQSLNPAERQFSDYFYSIGNPRLTPSFTDAFSLDFVLAGKFTIATGYSLVSNSIRQMLVSYPEYPERMYLTWENEGRDRNVFIHGDGSIGITDNWHLFAGLTYILTSQKFKSANLADSFGYIRLTTSTTIRLPKNFDLTINGFYSSRMKIGNITVYPILNFNPKLQKRFGRGWIIALSLENVMQRKSRTGTSSADYTRLSTTKNYTAVNIGVTYNFSSGKKFRMSKIEKNTDNTRFMKEI